MKQMPNLQQTSINWLTGELPKCYLREKNVFSYLEYAVYLPAVAKSGTSVYLMQQKLLEVTLSQTKQQTKGDETSVIVPFAFYIHLFHLFPLTFGIDQTNDDNKIYEFFTSNWICYSTLIICTIIVQFVYFSHCIYVCSI